MQFKTSMVKLPPPNKQLRQSNIEALRIVAMLMILVLHTRVNDIDTVYDGVVDTKNFMSFLFEAVSIVGVNLFILISGYFGIHLKRGIV